MINCKWQNKSFKIFNNVIFILRLKIKKNIVDNEFIFPVKKTETASSLKNNERLQRIIEQSFYYSIWILLILI